MFLDRQDVVDDFANRFWEIDGRLYFHMNGVKFLMPVSEEQVHDLTETFRLRARIAMAIQWVIVLGATVWWYSWYVSADTTYKGYWIAGGAFAGAFLVHFAANMTTTWPLQTVMMAVHEGKLPRPPDWPDVPEPEPEVGEELAEDGLES